MWSITFHEAGEALIQEQTPSFHDAWALVQPFCEDGYTWTMRTKADVLARFNAGAATVTVGSAYDVQGNRVARTILCYCPAA